jgi:hypothetical protein
MVVKLQIPIDKDIRDRLQKRAESLGFDSVQAYIRFWAKAEVDGRQVDMGEDDWGEPSPAAISRWEKQLKEIEVERKNGTLQSFSTVEEFMKDLK